MKLLLKAINFEFGREIKLRRLSVVFFCNEGAMIFSEACAICFPKAANYLFSSLPCQFIISGFLHLQGKTAGFGSTVQNLFALRQGKAGKPSFAKREPVD
ncbi:MAG: hypothetical protein SF097_17735 [Acidobacteriota bacterium]|nr:hypothetical protein [Acidobacteriota bacterium]